MTTIKLLSAGLIAAAMLATPVMAHENSAANRQVTEQANSRGAVRPFEGHVGLPAPHVAAFAAAPLDSDSATSATTRVNAEEAAQRPAHAMCS